MATPEGLAREWYRRNARWFGRLAGCDITLAVGFGLRGGTKKALEHEADVYEAARLAGHFGRRALWGVKTPGESNA